MRASRWASAKHVMGSVVEWLRRWSWRPSFLEFHQDCIHALPAGVVALLGTVLCVADEMKTGGNGTIRARGAGLRSTRDAAQLEFAS